MNKAKSGALIIDKIRLHTDKCLENFLDAYLLWWNKTPFVVFGNM